MKRAFYFFLFVLSLPVLLNSCGSSKRSKSKASARVETTTLQTKYARELGVAEGDVQNLRLYAFVDEWQGVPYRYGGTSKSGADCSGFVGALYREVYNKDLPRMTKDIGKDLNTISKSKLQEGDVVFFDIEGKKDSHVGVYLQNNKFVHASSSKGVVISSLDNPYYSKYFARGGR